MVLLFCKDLRSTIIYIERRFIFIMNHVWSPTFSIILSDRTCEIGTLLILGTLCKKHCPKYSQFSLDIIVHGRSRIVDVIGLSPMSLIHNASRGCIVSRCARPDDVEACRRIFTRGWREGNKQVGEKGR